MTNSSTLFSGVAGPAGTFMNVPAASSEPHPDVVVLGVPYDIATHPHRVGSRLGPAHIRVHSTQPRQFLSDREGDVFGEMTVVDAGDVVVTPGRPDTSYPAIERAVGDILSLGATPLTFGGDGAVTLPQLRAVAAHHPGLVVVHLDAHTDTLAVDPSEPYTNATTFTHAATEGLVDVPASIHLGVRGTTSVAGVVTYAQEIGYTVLATEGIRAASPQQVGHQLRSRLGDRPVYLCWDMDIFDPAVAPGVCTPEWGGLTAAEGIELLRSLDGLNLVAVDINTVSPPHDPAGLTASLAARVALEALFSIATARRSNHRPSSRPDQGVTR